MTFSRFVDTLTQLARSGLETSMMIDLDFLTGVLVHLVSNSDLSDESVTAAQAILALFEELAFSNSMHFLSHTVSQRHISLFFKSPLPTELAVQGLNFLFNLIHLLPEMADNQELLMLKISLLTEIDDRIMHILFDAT